MMNLWLTACFWLAALVVVYTFLLYPFLIALAARSGRRALSNSGPAAGGVSIILSVRNEQAHLNRRLEELVQLVAIAHVPGEIILISDGSTDDTAAIAKNFADRGVRLIEWTDNRGKAAALNCGVSAAQFEIIALADARQRWSADALEKLLVCFRDPWVGAVSGELVLESQSGVLAGVGLYWRFEKWLRNQEARFHSQIGVTGAICAVRRELFRPIPAGTILDDVYWPMQVVMQGRRVVFQGEAKAFDQLPECSGDEFRRKIRTLVGNFQLLVCCPALLLPWRNPMWWQFLSHKVLRLVTPWALLITLGTSGLLPGAYYRILCAVQVLGIGCGILGLLPGLALRSRALSTAGSFLLLQTAAWLAFWYWILGRSGKVWSQPTSSISPADVVGQP
jgi:cellulose synthase/poly-beta-1,6-N-acetylglucosamine synthase-like glycosyltransferase